jgi:hypothetical protein
LGDGPDYGLVEVVDAGELERLTLEIGLQDLDDRLAQLLAFGAAVLGVCTLISRSTSETASTRRTTSRAIGETTTGFLPAALRQAASSGSAKMKNGRRAWLQKPASRIWRGSRSGA